MSVSYSRSFGLSACVFVHESRSHVHSMYTLKTMFRELEGQHKHSITFSRKMTRNFEQFAAGLPSDSNPSAADYTSNVAHPTRSHRQTSTPLPCAISARFTFLCLGAIPYGSHWARSPRTFTLLVELVMSTGERSTQLWCMKYSAFPPESRSLHVSDHSGNSSHIQ